jgi:hypothetical protein
VASLQCLDGGAREVALLERAVDHLVRADTVLRQDLGAGCGGGSAERNEEREQRDVMLAHVGADSMKQVDPFP